MSRFPAYHDLSYLSPLQTFTDSGHSSSNILSTPPNLCQVQPSLSLKSHNTKIVVCSLLQEPKSLMKPYWPSNWHTTLSLRLSISWSSRSLSVLFSVLSLLPCPGPSMRLSLHVFVTPMNCPLHLYTTVTHIHACMQSRMYARTHVRTYTCPHASAHTRIPFRFSSVPTWISGFPSTYTVLLLTISTMATPRLHRMPKEIQNPRPLMMAMMYRLGMPQQPQSQTGRRGLGVCTGLPSSFSSMVSSSSSLVPSIFLHQKKNKWRIKASIQGAGKCTK